jgi:hypothetical protein
VSILRDNDQAQPRRRACLPKGGGVPGVNWMRMLAANFFNKPNLHIDPGYFLFVR